MNDDAPGLSPLSDISANMFAAFVLILLMAATASRPPAATPPPTPLATRDLQLVRRSASNAGDLVKLLFDRRPDAPGVGIDLTAAHALVLAQGRAPSALDARAAADEARLRAALTGASQAPVRLYVFANALYYPVAHALENTGRATTEISVPVALRAADGESWSAGFIALSRSTDDLDRFTVGLGRLLEGGASADSSASGSAGATRATSTAPAKNLIADWRRMIAALQFTLAFGATCGAALWIEFTTRRPRRRRV